MLGPVFQQELLLAGRQERIHGFRWAFAALLVVQVFYYLPSIYVATRLRHAGATVSPSAADQAFQFLAAEQLFILALVAPLFTAGAITEEKARGTLLPLLATHLTPRQIVLEKFASRLVQLLLLALTGLPLLAVAAGFAERPGVSALAVAAATLGPVVGLAAAGLLASVWCRTSTEAILATYLLLVGLYFAVSTFSYLQPLDPFYLLEAASGQAVAGRLIAGVDPLAELLFRLRGFALAWGVVSLGCLIVAAWRLRPAYFHQLDARRGWTGFLAGRRPPVEGDPLYWKELYVDGLVPFPLLRHLPRWLPWVAFALVPVGAVGWGLWLRMTAQVSPQEVLDLILQLELWRLAELGKRGRGSWPDGLVVAVALGVLGTVALLANVRAAAAFSGERERQTWDTLLMLPLSAKELVEGKQQGIVVACWRCLAAAAVPLLAFAALLGIESFIVALVLLVLAVPFTYLMAALGLSQSLRYQSTLASVVVSFLAGLFYAFSAAILFPCCCACQGGVISMARNLDLVPLGRSRELATMFLIGTVTTVVYASVFVAQAQECLKAAEDRLEEHRKFHRRRGEPRPSG